ncbi:site-specific integrase [Nocardia yamanashiensis]|uniref:tyrosine-type recombinase/integrase n=1 Tax=Nocardia yamanashiensis TaxID=209247 RepID=UPI001E3CCD99|nr:tyrosine-type recombinase/integrase [Nocardia yamanashiensis]UGT45169.1 site-specific integrase [Nocardia yamanashiensis]
MGWAQKLPSGRYSGLYRDSAGKVRRVPGTFTTKAIAERKATVKEDEVRESKYRPPEMMTWNEWRPRWALRRVVDEGTQKIDDHRMDKHLAPRWGTMMLTDILQPDVQVWVANLRKTLAPTSVEKCYRLLSASLRSALKANLISENPCHDIELPKAGPTPERYLEDDEFAALREPLDDFDRFIVDVLIGTGMRMGEAQGLHREHIDLKRKTISIEWAWDKAAKRMKSPKDHERRVIPIGANLAKILTVAIKKGGLGEPAPVRYVSDGRLVRSGLLLAHTDSRPFDQDNFRDRFAAAARVAWVGEGEAKRRLGPIRPHDLRHTYAGRLVRAQVPLQQVQALLGHASLRTTQRYAKLGDSQWDQVRQALG